MSSDLTSEAKFSLNSDFEARNQKQNSILRTEIVAIQEVPIEAVEKSQRSHVSRYTLQSKQKDIFDALSSFNTTKLKSILARIELQDSLGITELYDREGHNLLHKAAYDNTFRCSEMLILYYKQRMASHLKNQAMVMYNKSHPDLLSIDIKNNIKQEVRAKVAKWINTPSKSEQGFYPLHFASFHGNI